MFPSVDPSLAALKLRQNLLVPQAALSRILKVHKHEIFLNFFFTLIKSLYALGKFLKKFRLVSFDFRQNFEVRTFTR
jgi:hypothetical protein